MTQIDTEQDRRPSNGGNYAPSAVTPPAATPSRPPVRQPPAGRSFYHSRAFHVFLLVLVVLAIAATVYWLQARHFESTDDAFIDGHIIPISPQASALISAVHINDNQFVHKGDLLIELNPADYQAALAQAQGAEASAKGKLEQSRTSVPAAQSAVTEAQAEVDSAQVSFDNASRDLQRYQGLDQRAKSQQQLDNATAAQKTAAAQVAQAKARLESAQTEVTTASASVLAAEGDYQKAQADTLRARINLGYCRIVAPEDGRVTSKTVDPGMYVTPASQLFVLVPSDVWIVANFKETQLDLMRTGQKVSIKIDAYPEHEFQGTVQSIQAGTGSRFSVIPSENATGNFVKVVQRIPVKITFDGQINSDANHLLVPGMSVEPTVQVREGSFEHAALPFSELTMAMVRTVNSAAKPGVSPWALALVVSMATFMEVLDTSIANVSLRHIAGNLGAGQDESTWVLTSYLVANAIIIPISGWLSSVMGRKRFYMSCVALFTVSSLLCGLAPSLGMLLFFRVLQGAGGGGLAPSEQSILADTFQPEYFGMAFAIWGVAVVVAPALGPTLGGWITDNFSWRWIFFINIPVGALSLFLSYHLLQDSPSQVKKARETRQRGIKVDYVGFALCIIGLGALQVVLDKGQEDDWFGSPFICGFAALAVLGILGMVLWETLVVDDPIVDIPLLANPNLSSSMVLQFVVGFILTSTTVLLPQFVQQLLGYNATNAGLIIMPGGLVLMLMMPVAGKLVTRLPAKLLMGAGLLMTAGSMFYLTGFNTEVSFEHVVWVRVFQCVGLPLFFIPLNTIAYGNLPPGKNNNASAMMSLMRNLGGGIGISIATTLLVRRTQMHQERLSSTATHFYQPFVHYMNSHGGFTPHNIQSFYGLVQNQATMLAYLDVFKIMGIGCLLVICLLFAMRGVKKGSQPVLAH